MRHLPLIRPAFGLCLLAALLAGPGSAAAAPVTPKQATAAVTAWLARSQTPLGENLGASAQRVTPVNDPAGLVLYYVVDLKPAGFVIVSADDLVEPIIGFAGAGKFDASEANPLGALANRDLAARIPYARTTGLAPDSNEVRAQGKWRQLATTDGEPAASAGFLANVSDVRVPPLTHSTWSQETASGAQAAACYNYYTPPYGDGNLNNYPAGCVATALAQFMRFQQYPTTGVGPAGFTVYSDGSPRTYNLHGGDTHGGAYVWSNMPLSPSATPGAVACQAIGAVLADAGATVAMSYGGGGSSADMLAVKDALVGTFHYSSAVKGYGSSSGIGAGLTGMINPNLDAGCPVLFGIRGTSGHAVVADGYGYDSSTLYHHLNLGWSGTATAWYALPIVDADTHYYNVVDACIYNINTNGAGEIISGRVLDQIGRPVPNATVLAVRSAGGNYTAKTDSLGIYALTHLPSTSSYAISVTKDNSSSATNNFPTGNSADWGASSGNYWGANFTWNMSSASLDHLVWDPIAAGQSINTPFAVTLTARNLTNGVATAFNGPVTLSASATVFGLPTVILGNKNANFWLFGSEVTHGYIFTPATNLQVTAVRGYNTDKVSVWTDSGTLLASQAVSAAGSWVEATLTTPITLIAGMSYRVGAHIPAGMNGYVNSSSWPGTFANGTVGQSFYYSYGDICPVTIYGTGEGPLVDLRYRVVSSNTLPVSPTSSGAFVSGVWNGNVIAGAVATNVVLKADDGAGHAALSNPFAMVDPDVLVAAHPTLTLNPGAIVYAVAPLADGSVIFGGNFTSVNGVARPNLARLQPDGALDPAWIPAPNAQVLALAVSGTNLFVGGVFTSIGAYGRNFIAKLNTTGSGAADPAWNPVADDYVETLAASGSDLFVGGYFTTIGGQNRSCLAKLSTTGSGVADPTWNPHATISGDYPAVYCLALGGGNVYAGGYFTGVGGQTRVAIARLSATGSGAADTSWNPAANGVVDSVLTSGNYVYLGGVFTQVGGQNRARIARLNSTGTGTADAWNPGADGEVWSLAINGLALYAGGSFTNLGGLHRAGLAKICTLSTGAVKNVWAADCDGRVNTVISTGGALYIGGSFTRVAGQGRAGLAVLTCPALRLLSAQCPVAAGFQFTLAGERGQAFEILASTNLLNWDAVATLTNLTGSTNYLDSTPVLNRRYYRAHQLP